MTLQVTREALDHIRCAMLKAGEREACGLLLGARDGNGSGESSGSGEIMISRITQAVETVNVHPTPETRFELHPQALINAYRIEREGGPLLLGYFHSHPHGQAVPSETDQAMAPGDGRIWAIASQREVRFWRDDPKGFAPLVHEII